MTAGSVEPLRKLYLRWNTQVEFLDVVIRQAHPGPDVPAYELFEQKVTDGERYKLEDSVPYPVLIDDLQGSTHQVYGGLADPAYLIDRDGFVSFYNMWTHAPTLHEAIEELIENGGRGIVKGGVHRAAHLLPIIANGWEGLRRGLPQSVIEVELSGPGSGLLMWLGYQAKPILAPIAQRAKPLPGSAKVGLKVGGAALAGATAALIKKRTGEIGRMKLRKIGEQVILITGATSGIGLTTARMAAEQGAHIVAVARNEDALRELTDEINGGGGRAIYHACDVADEGALRQAAQKAVNAFGRIDTWVNNAGGAIIGRFADVPNKDSHRLFDTNFWGVVNGSRIALEYLRDKGGAIINLGSDLSDAPIPFLAIYVATKHAVKGFTDALRMEIEADKLPISVTLIKPAAIHTPFSENSKNYMTFEPKVPPPVYAPDLVAEAILHSARYPTRDFFVGEMAAIHSGIATYLPRVNDKVMAMVAEPSLDSGEASVINRRDGLHQTNSKLHERGSEDRFVIEESPYQRAMIHPIITTGLLVGSGLAVAALINSLRSKKSYGDDRYINNGGFQENKGRQFMADMDFNIAEDMEVVGSDGEHVGTVDRVEGDNIKLTRNDPEAGGEHHFLSVDMVDSVENDTVTLNATATEAKAMWQSA